MSNAITQSRQVQNCLTLFRGSVWLSGENWKTARRFLISTRRCGMRPPPSSAASGRGAGAGPATRGGPPSRTPQYADRRSRIRATAGSMAGARFCRKRSSDRNRDADAMLRCRANLVRAGNAGGSVTLRRGKPATELVAPAVSPASEAGATCAAAAAKPHGLTRIHRFAERRRH